MDSRRPANARPPIEATIDRRRTPYSHTGQSARSTFIVDSALATVAVAPGSTSGPSGGTDTPATPVSMARSGDDGAY